jgi:hypothetical protein
MTDHRPRVVTLLEELTELADELGLEPWEAASLVILAHHGHIDLVDAVLAEQMPLQEALQRAVLEASDMTRFEGEVPQLRSERTALMGEIKDLKSEVARLERENDALRTEGARS